MGIPIMRPVINKEMVEAATAALQNEKLVLGESVYKFEEKFAEYCGTKYAVSTSSGTNALTLALKAVGVGKNDKVLTTTMSFIATGNCILHNNATPTFVDCSNKDGNIDVSKIKMNGEKVVLPVHLYGNVCDMKELNEVKGDAFVIEDAAEAHGATYNGKKAGNLGDLGCFSFYTTKNMTVGGDGGMITTNNEEYANLIKKYCDCGRTSKYEHDVVGFTARLNSINAAIGLVQLRHLDGWNQRRRAIASIYHKKLPKEVQLDYKEGCVYYTYTIRLRERDKVAKYLSDNGVGNGIYFPIPIHLQEVYKNTFRYKGGEFPVAEKFAKEILSLPMNPEMTDEEVNIVCEQTNEALK